MQKTFNRLSLIFSAFLFSSFIYVIVGFALSRTGLKPVLSASLQSIVFWIFVTLSVSDLAIVLKIKNQPAETDERRVISRSILCYALAEIPSILGLVYFALSVNSLYALILWAVSIVIFVLVRPANEA
jgi:hypothetical protein